MKSAAARTLEPIAPNGSGDLLNTSSHPTSIQVSGDVNLDQASFSFSEGIAVQGQNPLALIFSENVMRMWLGESNHVAISSINGEANIRVTNNLNGSVQISDALKLDQVPGAISVSPDGDKFLIIMKNDEGTSEGVCEYTVSSAGKLRATFSYYDPQVDIREARYSEKGVTIVANSKK